MHYLKQLLTAKGKAYKFGMLAEMFNRITNTIKKGSSNLDSKAVFKI